jgi:hypothetical protein
MTNISLSAHLPSNFDVDDFLKKEKSNVTKRKNIKAAMYYILNTLYNMSMQRKYRVYFEENGGHPLSSKIMNDILGKRYLEALNLLEKHGVISRSGSYQVGEKSKLVSLTEKYSSTEIKIRQIPSDANISKKILDNRLLIQNENQTALGKIPFVTKWFDPSRLSVNEKTVHGFIEFYRAELIGRIPNKLPKGRTSEEIISRINQRVNSMLDTMNSFRRGEMRLSKTGKDHRLHSFLSNTKKELRTLYLFDGKPMVSLDLKSSQPYLFTYLLNPKNWVFIKQDIFPELFTDILTQEEQHQLYSILMFGGFNGIKSTMSNNKPGFYDILWENDFYSLLVERAKSENMVDVFPDRAAAKKAMMMLLFDDGWYKDDSKEFQLFSKWFTHEAELIKLIKQLSRIVKSNSSDHDTAVINILPILLQRVESRIILEEICEVISQELPDAPLLPVHDCIQTTEEYVEEVFLIMERELKRIVGITPGIKIKKCSQQQTLNELSKLADEDMLEIINKKSKGSIRMGIKPPFLLSLPEKDFDMLISDRYINPDFIDDGNENIIRLIDDTKELKPVGNIFRRE